MSAAVRESGITFQDVGRGETLVRVKNLKKYFPVTEGMLIQRTVANVKAVDDVSFEIKRGETLGLVGESGCDASCSSRRRPRAPSSSAASTSRSWTRRRWSRCASASR